MDCSAYRHPTRSDWTNPAGYSQADLRLHMAALFPSDHAVVDVVAAAASFPVVVAAFAEISVAVDPDGFVIVAVVAFAFSPSCFLWS